MITAYSNTRSVTTLPEPAFTFTMNTNNVTNASTGIYQYKLPLVSSSSTTYTNADLDIMVDWGDGSVDNITVYNQPEVTHTYEEPGEYRVRITGGVFGWKQSYTGDKEKIVDIQQWDGLIVTEINTFGGCAKMTSSVNADCIIATDNISGMFDSCTIFNGPLNDLDISGVTNIDYMFWGMEQFNQPLDKWDTSNVVYMNGPWGETKAFNQDISSWDVSKVEESWGMFYYAEAFNNGGSPDINNWNFASLTYAENTFEGCKAFNQPIDNWNVSQLDSLWGWFQDNEGFNQSLSNWDVSNIEYFSYLFSNSKDFNNGGDPGINNWDTSSGTYFERTFQQAGAFNLNITNWDFSSSVNLNSMFYDNKVFQNGGQPLDWTIPAAYINWMFGESEYNNPTRFTFNGTNQNAQNMFSGWSSGNVIVPFNQDVSLWDVSGVTRWNNAFADSAFNDQGVLSWNWNPNAVTSSMFWNTPFNYPILSSGTFTASITNPGNMYAFGGPNGLFNNGGELIPNDNRFFYNNYLYAPWNYAEVFNQPFDHWDFSQYTKLDYFFNANKGYTQDISGWDVSNIVSAYRFMQNMTYPTALYDATLIAWSEKLPDVSSIPGTEYITFGSSKYTGGGAAAAARAAIIAKGWVVQDGGAV